MTDDKFKKLQLEKMKKNTEENFVQFLDSMLKEEDNNAKNTTLKKINKLNFSYERLIHLNPTFLAAAILFTNFNIDEIDNLDENKFFLKLSEQLLENRLIYGERKKLLEEMNEKDLIIKTKLSLLRYIRLLEKK